MAELYKEVATTDALRTAAGGCSTNDEHIGWNAMVKKLEGEGHSKESAEKIAGYINKEKYGK